MLTITTNYGAEEDKEFSFLVETPDKKTYGIVFENREDCNRCEFRVHVNNVDLSKIDLDIIRNLDFISIKSLTQSAANDLDFPDMRRRSEFDDDGYFNEAGFEMKLSGGNIIHILCSNHHNGHYAAKLDYYNEDGLCEFYGNHPSWDYGYL